MAKPERSLYSLLDLVSRTEALRDAALSASVGADIATDVEVPPPPGPQIAADLPEGIAADLPGPGIGADLPDPGIAADVGVT